MSGIAVIFPGQGSQYPGMGAELARVYPEARRIFEEADDLAGYSISRMCFEGPVRDLNMTIHCQPAVLCCSLAAYEVLKDRAPMPAVMGGLSLGEYTALTASGSIEFKDVLPLIQIRARLMQEAVPAGEGAMAVVMGVSTERVLELCRQVVGRVYISNYNAPGQLVVAGECQAVGEVKEMAHKAGGRAMKLAVSVPSHCPMMSRAAEEFLEHLARQEWQKPEVPVISNVTARIHEKDGLAGLMARQINSPVLWEQSIGEMSLRAGLFIEVGPGSSLSSTIKRIDRGVAVAGVEDCKSLNNAIEKVNMQ